MARNEEEPPPWGLTTGLQVRRRKCIPQEPPHWISVLLWALLGLCKEGTQTWNGRLAVTPHQEGGGYLMEESGCRSLPTSELLDLHTGGSQSLSGQSL